METMKPKRLKKIFARNLLVLHICGQMDITPNDAGENDTEKFSLAQYYQNMNDPKTGVYFHEKCLEISRLIADRGGEMSANHRLGVAYEKMVRESSTSSQLLFWGW